MFGNKLVHVAFFVLLRWLHCGFSGCTCAVIPNVFWWLKYHVVKEGGSMCLVLTDELTWFYIYKCLMTCSNCSATYFLSTWKVSC